MAPPHALDLQLRRRRSLIPSDLRIGLPQVYRLDVGQAVVLLAHEPGDGQLDQGRRRGSARSAEPNPSDDPSSSRRYTERRCRPRGSPPARASRSATRCDGGPTRKSVSRARRRAPAGRTRRRPRAASRRPPRRSNAGMPVLKASTSSEAEPDDRDRQGLRERLRRRDPHPHAGEQARPESTATPPTAPGRCRPSPAGAAALGTISSWFAGGRRAGRGERPGSVPRATLVCCVDVSIARTSTVSLLGRRARSTQRTRRATTPTAVHDRPVPVDVAQVGGPRPRRQREPDQRVDREGCPRSRRPIR